MPPLPSRLRERLAALARRVRHLRRLRGVSLLLLVLACCAAPAVLADLALTLPPAVRAVDLAAWVLLGAAVAFVYLIRPLRRRLAPADLAAVVEKHYPELQERLTSSVELASADAPPTGLVARLLDETDERTRSLDFAAAVPAGPTRRLCISAGVVAALALVPAALAPAEFGRLAARFFAPWHSPADFAFVVHPGDVVAARGRPLTVRVTLVPRDPSAAFPCYCTLVLDATRSDLVPGDDPSTYAVTFPVVDSARYRVEAGNGVSPWHALTAVTPTDLAPDSPSVVVTPPAEAASFAETQTLAGMVDVAAFAGSEIAFRFAFDRPATAAVVEWTPEGKPAETIPLALADEGRSATWSLRATHAGAYRLVIAGERGVETAREGGHVTVRPLPEPRASPPDLAKNEAKERIEDLAGRQKELADRAADAKTEEEAGEIAKTQAELTRELDRLAKDEPPPEDALAERAKALAEDQRDLARAADATERKHDAEQLADVAKRQRDLQKRAEALAKETAAPARANFARPLNDDAGRAAESMERGDTQQALDAQDRAARDLDRLARDLARLADAAKDAREAVRQLSRLQDDIAKRTRAEADREDAAPLAERLKDLLREQEALRRAVRDLDSKAAEGQADAAKAMAKGDAKRALVAMESARLSLRAAANGMKAGDKMDKPLSLLPNEGQAKKARDLAAEQRALRREAQEAAAQSDRERRADASKARREQQAMQDALKLRAGALAKDLAGMPAAKNVHAAEAAMRAAQAMAKQGDATSARAMREQAAKALERVARPGKGGALQEARELMGRAQEQLGKGPPADASGPMREAASRLRLAGRQTARSGSAPGVAVDARPFPKELTPHVGKRWGDLPGDLRTRLVQQMKARYGDDYARSIKLYFEQLADTRRRP